MITAIVLASGYSSRMGKNKLLLLKDNIPMVEHLFRQLSRINFHKVIVVTQYDEVDKLAESYGYISVINMTPQNGISESIKLGVKNTDADSNFMFFTGDQPFLRGEVIKKIMDISEDGCIAVPRLSGKRKSPVIFGRVYREELLKLDGDTGGKEIINKNLNSVKYLDFSGGNDFLDIDTVEEYEKIR
ncbi:MULTISPECIES: nucleotidyltransferase family protein [Psychrilyobacter]|uniref:Molybdenum cofactor cytidylyltransferase n=1 Tax=Psychrilyobacter piezotolerans TaxID=2293438 RepID=A0ABX9KHS5_9FUSO|nr:MULTISPECIES: NTP transferase domain-containing protein [Psychrilyobacter]MCS5421829.1 nucleotidyltransferase family protein [Psychrilyobacter sp. S5]NDI77573.1 NTP transferase domain-containing protein [Psychrilyobacter piezotolerans]RDE62917.1 molybdenum cofactor cytidylyltransferase [Psychrilyobacter sp. S5]REI41675.1 molybdenum cofactor cytidylyltransferase [Psychrilyobacter piezotolerans]